MTVDDSPVCLECAARLRVRPSSEYEWRSDPGPPSGGYDPEQRFEALFEAARLLLKEDISEEDRVIPTLAFAAEIGRADSNLVDMRERLAAAQVGREGWETESEKFVRAHPNLRPVRVTGGVLVLEWVPVSVGIVDYAHPKIVMPRMVVIEVYPHRYMVEPDHVEALYENTLSAKGIAYGDSREGSMSFRFFSGRLSIQLKHRLGDAPIERLQAFYPDGKPVFPHPYWVRRYYEMLMGTPSGPGFAQFLITRSRGRTPDSDTLIPACVAVYLRHYAKIEGRKEIHRLLNEHVLSETWKTLPVEGYASSEVNQLWRDVEKIKNRALAAGLNLSGPTLVP
jgi:hypothetical protein